MNKRGKAFIGVISVLLIFSLFQIQAISSDEGDQSLSPVPAKSTTGKGGAGVPITTTELTDQGEEYDIKPGRIKFDFEGEGYAVQLRRIKEDYTEILVIKLDESKPDDITAFTTENSFNLVLNEKNEVDLNNDGTDDVVIRLNSIKKEKGKHKTANLFIKKIK